MGPPAGTLRGVGDEQRRRPGHGGDGVHHAVEDAPAAQLDQALGTPAVAARGAAGEGGAAHAPRLPAPGGPPSGSGPSPAGCPPSPPAPAPSPPPRPAAAR